MQAGMETEAMRKAREPADSFIRYSGGISNERIF